MEKTDLGVWTDMQQMFWRIDDWFNILRHELCWWNWMEIVNFMACEEVVADIIQWGDMDGSSVVMDFLHWKCVPASRLGWEDQQLAPHHTTPQQLNATTVIWQIASYSFQIIRSRRPVQFGYSRHATRASWISRPPIIMLEYVIRGKITMSWA